MRLTWLAVAVTWWGAGGLVASAQTNSLHRSVSVSRQFICYAAQPLVPTALGYLAEQVKREWLRTLDLRDQWRDPILLVVESATSPATPTGPRLRVFQTDLHLKYQISWTSPPGVDPSTLVAALVEALNAELANREQPLSRTTPYVAPPQPLWLTLGLARAIQGRDERLLQLARRTRLDGQAPRGTLLLATATAPATAAERDLLEAHAWLFVQGLLSLPDGAAKLRNFLTTLGATKTVSTSFWETYRTDFAGEPEFERWWAVQFANRTTTVVAENLTPDDTARRLAGILRTTVSGPDPAAPQELPVADLATHTDAPWWRDVVTEKRLRLANLHAVASPLYWPTIAAYQEAFQWLAQGSRVRFRRTLVRAEKLRDDAAETARGIRSYLDAVELQHAPGDWAPDFSATIQLLGELEQIERQRRTPISDYLDQFDQ